MNNYKITPSIMTSDLLNLESELNKLKGAGIEWLHFDIMDGKFAKQLGLSPIQITQIKSKFNFTIDVHCMVNELENIIDELEFADYITIHYSSIQTGGIERIFNLIREKGKKVGLAIDLNDNFEDYKSYIGKVDIILIMAIIPGFAGQTFDFRTWQTINKITNHKAINVQKTLLQIDGGVRWSNISRLIKKGIDLIVVGSLLFNENDYKMIVEKIKNETIKSIKIWDHIYLGDRYSKPSFVKNVFSCAEELFPKNIADDIAMLDNNYYFKLVDFAKVEDISIKLIKEILEIIEKKIIREDVYIHCRWGVNRSATISFMIMVRNKFLKAENFEAAKKEFSKIYPPFEPNPGYAEFIKKYYPFNF